MSAIFENLDEMLGVTKLLKKNDDSFISANKKDLIDEYKHQVNNFVDDISA
jgi:hypothetical protein